MFRSQCLQVVYQLQQLLGIFIIALEKDQTANTLLNDQFFGSGVEGGALKS